MLWAAQVLVIFATALADDACVATDEPDMAGKTQLLQVRKDNAVSQNSASILLDESGPMDLAHIQTITSSTGKCLNFLHIPKNAGSTIETISYNSAHLGGPKVEFGKNNPHLKCSGARGANNECVISDGAGHVGNCSAWHVPPVFDATIAAGYAGCETFCITRHPLTRAWSQHVYVGNECSAESFALNMLNKAAELKANPFTEDCHWLTQSSYIADKKHCQHLLRFETLEEDFNALMVKFEIPLSLDKTHVSESSCELRDHIDKVPPHTIEFIETYFADDYKTGGYDKDVTSVVTH